MAPKGRPGGPTETQEQIRLFARLRKAGISAFHVPNGGARSSAREGRILKLAGVEEGVVDVLIVDVPEGSDKRGTALEMKRASGSWSDVSEAQRRWLEYFVGAGWFGVVGYGCRDAVEKLRSIGYVLALLLALSGPANALDVPTYQSRTIGALTGSYALDAELVLAGLVADVDPLYFAAVTYTESRWIGSRSGDAGRSHGLWQITSSAVQAVADVSREQARNMVRTPFVRSLVAGLYWRRLIRRYGRAHAAAVYTCGPKCRNVFETRTSRGYRRHYRRLRREQ
jgi:hypothetical protein